MGTELLGGKGPRPGRGGLRWTEPVGMRVRDAQKTDATIAGDTADGAAGRLYRASQGQLTISLTCMTGVIDV